MLKDFFDQFQDKVYRGHVDIGLTETLNWDHQRLYHLHHSGKCNNGLACEVSGESEQRSHHKI